jgi:hypothetical protein
MATEQTYNGDANDKTFDITFPYLTHADIGVSVGGVTKTVGSDYSITGNTVTFTTAPASGTANVKLYRNTNIDTPEHEYSAGSSITAARLNENQKQALYAIEEAKLVTTTSGGITTGNKNDITVNSDTDWVIRANAVEKSMMSDNSVGTAEIETNAVTTTELKDDASTDGNRAVTRNHIRNDAIDGTKIADDAVDSEHIAADSIDAEHYAPGSVDDTALASNAVTNVKVADDAIGVAELSATGTASSSTFLRGDNAWAAPVSLFSGMALLEDEKSQGTGGGAVTASGDNAENTWVERDLNQERFDTGNFVTLWSNKFTLLAGTYLIKWSAPAHRVDGHKTRLYDVTNSAVSKTGTSEFTNDGAAYTSNRSFGMHYLTIGSSTQYRIEHYFSNESTTEDYEQGYHLTNEGAEIYTQVEIYKFN